MKVLLLKDVYKLGRAGDVKRVADGYGRNFLLPQGLAVLATAGAVKQADQIRNKAATERATLNKELGGMSEILNKVVVTFPARAGETGKLYGSITPQMIADAIKEKAGVEVDRRQMDSEPIRTLGEHKLTIRLTMDLVPEVTVIVHREGEVPVLPGEEDEERAEAQAEEAAAPAGPVAQFDVEEVPVEPETVEPAEEA